MYPHTHAVDHPDRPAFVMAGTGTTVTYAELEARANRLAHLLRSEGLHRGQHYSVFMENHERHIECSAAGERTGLYYTCINSYLTAEEVAYIVDNSDSEVLITSKSRQAVALQAAADCPKLKLVLVVDGAELPSTVGSARVADYVEATAGFPTDPIADESAGTAMLYSSGTTGRPKGILRPLPDGPGPFLHRVVVSRWHGAMVRGWLAAGACVVWATTWERAVLRNAPLCDIPELPVLQISKVLAGELPRRTADWKVAGLQAAFPGHPLVWVDDFGTDRQGESTYGQPPAPMLVVAPEEAIGLTDAQSRQVLGFVERHGRG